MIFENIYLTNNDDDPTQACKLEVRLSDHSVWFLIHTASGDMITMHADRADILRQATKGGRTGNLVAMILTGLRGNANSKGIIPPVISSPASIERTGLNE